MLYSKESKDTRHPINDFDFTRMFSVVSLMPFIGSYLTQIYNHLSVISPKSKLSQEKASLKYLGIGVAFLMICIGILCEVMPNWSMKFGACILSYWLFVQSIEFVLVRQQVLLLKDLVSFIGDVRSHYFDTWMVEESVFLALQGIKTAKRTGMLAQGGLLLEMLESPDDEFSLDSYNRQAPNQYLKLFACMLYVTKEYGDSPSGQPSKFARSLNLLLQEVREEVLWREQLSFALKSLNGVIIMPLFVLLPIKSWASESFEVMKVFYSGSLGFLCENFVMCMVLLSTYLLREIHYNEGDLRLSICESQFFEGLTRPPRPIKWFMSVFQKGNTSAGIEWWQALTKEQQLITSDYLGRLKLVFICLSIYSLIAVYAIFLNVRIPFRSPALDFVQQNIVSERGELFALTNLALMGGVLIAFLCWISVAGYRKFLAYLSQLASQSEVNRFHTVILTTMHVPQLGVDGILHWMEKFSVTYKSALQKAILDFDAGGLKALKELHNASKTHDFVKIVTQLMMAVESLPISKAFEELESEKAYFQEKRRVEQLRFVQKKINLGQIIGFVPTYATLIVYFMIPMIYASVTEMQRYVEVLN